MQDEIAPRERILVIDDDIVFARVLSRALDARGFDSATANTAAAALDACRREAPRYAVLDLKLGADNGLKLITELKALVPDLHILLLTGYASIATAVEAIKRGAENYLAKPVDADAVVAALRSTRTGTANQAMPAVAGAPSLKRLEWEHIHRVLAECDGNISAAARWLHMHRRTLQRKLTKHPVHH
ncbi:MAG: response regulator transcription factor [Rudaea sp.]